MYTSHVLKDQEGRVVCPALYIYKYTIFVENIYIYIYKKTSDMIFVKTFTRPPFWGQTIYAKNATKQHNILRNMCKFKY